MTQERWPRSDVSCNRSGPRLLGLVRSNPKALDPSQSRLYQQQQKNKKGGTKPKLGLEKWTQINCKFTELHKEPNQILNRLFGYINNPIWAQKDSAGLKILHCSPQIWAQLNQAQISPSPAVIGPVWSPRLANQFARGGWSHQPGKWGPQLLNIKTS